MIDIRRFFSLKKLFLNFMKILDNQNIKKRTAKERDESLKKTIAVQSFIHPVFTTFIEKVTFGTCRLTSA